MKQEYDRYQSRDEIEDVRSCEQYFYFPEKEERKKERKKRERV